MSIFECISINEEITTIKEELKKVEDELSLCPYGNLNIEKRKGQFFYLYAEDSKTRYGITKNDDMLARLARKAYLTKKAEILRNNIKVLEPAANKYIPATPDTVLNSLNERFAAIDSEIFLTSIDKINGSGAGNATDTKNAEEWARAEFEQYAEYPEMKKIPVGNGEFVRSKSELLIARELMRYKIPFRYEEILHLSPRERFAPDFTIRKKDGKIFYWEHFGRTFDESYMKKNTRKLGTYAEYGIGQWDNLIVTYDTPDGIIDMKEVEFFIRNRLM